VTGLNETAAELFTSKVITAVINHEVCDRVVTCERYVSKISPKLIVVKPRKDHRDEDHDRNRQGFRLFTCRKLNPLPG